MPWGNVCDGLDDLTDKSVLDLDCGSGFVCAFAAFGKAKSVLGLSTDASTIAKVQRLLPECSFACHDWHKLGQEKYDVIIVPHTLHHGKDLKQHIAMLMEHLTPWGTLVLEVKLVKGREEQGFFKIGTDPTLYPAQETFRAMLDKWTWRNVRHNICI